MNEEQFLQAMKLIIQKDKAGLKEIYEAYIGFIYHVVLDIVKNKENAEDITSDFFIRLWEKAGQYSPGNGHKAYLAAIARNMAIDFIRKYKKEELSDEIETEGAILPNQSVTPEHEVVESLTINEALNRLKPVYRQIVSMKVLGEMTFKEISAVLEIPMGTVTWNYQDAIKQLRRYGYE